MMKKLFSGGGNDKSSWVGKSLLVGRHQCLIEELIAEGGFALVFLAKASGGQRYALKRVSVNEMKNLEMCKQEIDVLKMLSGHKNTIGYIDSVVNVLSPGIYEVLILMEYCKAGHVVQLMNECIQTGFTEKMVMKIFCDVTEAVALLHANNPPIIHRDLKVENVLRKQSGDFVLCDYGSTYYGEMDPEVQGIQSIDEEISSYTTLAYRAPEMVDLYSGQKITIKSDIWAMGCLLYKLCFFTTPFGESTLAIQSGQFTVPESSRYSDKMHTLIKMMLVVDQSKRADIFQVANFAFQMTGRPSPVRNISMKQVKQPQPQRPIPVTSAPRPHADIGDSDESRSQYDRQQPSQSIQSQQPVRLQQPVSTSLAPRQRPKGVAKFSSANDAASPTPFKSEVEQHSGLQQQQQQARSSQPYDNHERNRGQLQQMQQQQQQIHHREQQQMPRQQMQQQLQQQHQQMSRQQVTQQQPLQSARQQMPRQQQQIFDQQRQQAQNQQQQQQSYYQSQQMPKQQQQLHQQQQLQQQQQRLQQQQQAFEQQQQMFDQQRQAYEQRMQRQAYELQQIQQAREQLQRQQQQEMQQQQQLQQQQQQQLYLQQQREQQRMAEYQQLLEQQQQRQAVTQAEQQRQQYLAEQQRQEMELQMRQQLQQQNPETLRNPENNLLQEANGAAKTINPFEDNFSKHSDDVFTEKKGLNPFGSEFTGDVVPDVVPAVARNRTANHRTHFRSRSDTFSDLAKRGSASDDEIDARKHLGVRDAGSPNKSVPDVRTMDDHAVVTEVKSEEDIMRDRGPVAQVELPEVQLIKTQLKQFQLHSIAAQQWKSGNQDGPQIHMDLGKPIILNSEKNIRMTHSEPIFAAGNNNGERKPFSSNEALTKDGKEEKPTLGEADESPLISPSTFVQERRYIYVRTSSCSSDELSEKSREESSDDEPDNAKDDVDYGKIRSSSSSSLEASLEKCEAAKTLGEDNPARGTTEDVFGSAPFKFESLKKDITSKNLLSPSRSQAKRQQSSQNEDRQTASDKKSATNVGNAAGFNPFATNSDPFAPPKTKHENSDGNATSNSVTEEMKLSTSPASEDPFGYAPFVKIVKHKRPMSSQELAAHSKDTGHHNRKIHHRRRMLPKAPTQE